MALSHPCRASWENVYQSLNDFVQRVKRTPAGSVQRAQGAVDCRTTSSVLSMTVSGAAPGSWSWWSRMRTAASPIA